MAKANLVKFKGLVPLLDRKRLGEPYIVDGKNFYVDADGPLSGFAKTEVFHKAVAQSDNVQSFPIQGGTRLIIFSSGVVLDYCNITQCLIPIFTFQQPAVIFPWTHATVGGLEYFARKGIGLLQFNTIADQWTLISGPSVPADIQACCESGGRLIVAATGISAWSAIDDGTDFVPSTTTGAGAQSLSLIAATDADDIITTIAVAEGYLTITKNGIMRSRLIERLNPFRHTRMTESHEPLPVNPFCVVEMARFQHVMLTRQGFFQIADGKLIPWQQLMGEFFHARQLPFFDIDNVPNIVRLSIDNDRQWFIVSVATSQAPSQYSLAYVLYIPSDEWGVFNQQHSAFITLGVPTVLQTGFPFGFVDIMGSIFRFTDGSIDNIWPTPRRETYDYIANREFPARKELTENIMPSRLVFSPIDEGIFNDVSGVYNLEFEFASFLEPISPDAPAEFPAVVGTPYEMKTVMQIGNALTQLIVKAESFDEQDLDSFIEIGLLRFSTENVDPDEMSMITNVNIGMLTSGDTTAGTVFDDWLLDYSLDVFFNWLTDTTGNEDWGEGLATQAVIDYSASIRGSNDGYETYGTELIPQVLMKEDLTLAKTQGRTRYYTCDNNGLFHLVRIGAENPGHAYHLKTMEVRGYLTGRVV